MSDDLDALLDAAVARKVEQPETDTVDVLVGGAVWTLKFTEMDSRDWTNVCAVNPMRLGSVIDRNYGYNFDGAAETAAPMCGVRVDGDVETKLSDEQWAKLFKAISGHEHAQISSALFGLNAVAPMQRLGAAKKAQARAVAKKQS